MLERIRKSLKSTKKILLISHQDPDGDAVGSMILTEALLKKLKPTAKIYKIIDSSYKPELAYYLKKHKFSSSLDGLSWDYSVAVDSAVNSRLFPLTGAVDLNIDHHADNSNFGRLNLVQPLKPATGLIVYSLLKKAKIKLNKDLAEALYLAIHTDTGGFAFANTDQSVFEAALAAVKAGVNPNEFYNRVYEQLEVSTIKSLGEALHGVHSFFSGRLIMSVIEKNNSLDNRLLIDFIRREKKASVVTVLTAKKDHIKVSLRAKDKTDVGKIARAFLGGGHPSAASGKIMTTNILTAQKTLLKYFKENVF